MLPCTNLYVISKAWQILGGNHQLAPLGTVNRTRLSMLTKLTMKNIAGGSSF